MAELKLTGETSHGYVVKLSTNGHQFISDANSSDGGTSSAPSPKDLFLSSVAGCKLMTMQMYVDRKGWEVNNINIEMTFNTEDTDEYVIEQDITIDSDLEEKQIQRIINIAEKCPVAKYMKQGIIFKNKINND